MTERTLVKKLAEVMAEVQHVEKKGRNTHFNYDFVRESDMLAAVRPAFAKRNLIMTVSALPDTTKQNGNVLMVAYTCTIHDGDSGEELDFTVLGAGQDTQDKGPYKALTGAVKYALMKLLFVDTGDDPENEAAPKVIRSNPRTRTASAAPTGVQDSTSRLITGITMKSGGDPTKPWSLFRISFDNGLQVSTFDKKVAEVAKGHKEAGRAVNVLFEETPKGNNLLALTIPEFDPDEVPPVAYE